MNNPLFKTLIEATGWTLLHFVWQAVIAVVVLWLALRLIRNKSAQARYVVSCSVFFLLMTISLGTFFLHFDTEANKQQAPLRSTMNSETDIVSGYLKNPAEFVPLEEVVGSDLINGPGRSQTFFQKILSFEESISVVLKPWMTWIVTFWLIGVSLLSIKLMNSWRMVRGMVQSGKTPDDSIWLKRLETLKKQLGISKSVRLLVSSATTVPIVIGWLKPVILVPSSVLMGMDSEMLEAILAHELAHIRRHDYLINMIQNVVEILFFYHPGLKWISNQIRIERECCCDDMASKVSGGNLFYAQALTALVQMRPEPAAYGLAANGGSLLMRIRRLMKMDQPEMTTATGSGLLTTSLLALLVMVPLFFVFVTEDVDADINQVAESRINQVEKKSESETQNSETKTEDSTQKPNEKTAANEPVFLNKLRGLAEIRSRGENWIEQFQYGGGPSTSIGQTRIKYLEELNELKQSFTNGFSVPVKIINENDEPIPETEISMSILLYGYQIVNMYKVKTDEKGESILTNITKSPHVLTLSASGYEPLKVRDIDFKSNKLLVLKMKRVELTTGIVLNHDGTPAKGVKLLLKGIAHRSDFKMKTYFNGAEEKAVTDQDGKFVLDKLENGSRYLFVLETENKLRKVVTNFVSGTKNIKVTLPVKTAPEAMGNMINGSYEFDMKQQEWLKVKSVKKKTITKQKAAVEIEGITLNKYDDGKADGKKSIAGTGEMVEFSLPDENQQLKGIQIHCSRYGYPKAPKEDVEISIVSHDEVDLIHTELVPYSKFKRGDAQWTTINFEDAVNVPEKFWVIVDFNAEKTKGVYVSYDESTKGKYSKTGVPGGDSEKVKFKGDWMIRTMFTDSKSNK